MRVPERSQAPLSAGRLEGDAQERDVGQGPGHEGSGGLLALIVQNLAVDQEGVLIGGVVQTASPLPRWPGPPWSPECRIHGPATRPGRDTAQYLDVHVHQPAGTVLLVAHRRWMARAGLRGPIKVGQGRHAVAREDRPGRGAGRAHVAGDPRMPPAPAEAQDHHARLTRGKAVGAVLRTTGTVIHGHPYPVAVGPLPERRRADLETLSHPTERFRRVGAPDDGRLSPEAQVLPIVQQASSWQRIARSFT